MRFDPAIDSVICATMPVAGMNATRNVIAYANGFRPATATCPEHGFVCLAVVGKLELVKSRALLPIAQARALFASPFIQTGEIGPDFKQWLKVAVAEARKLKVSGGLPIS